MTENSSEVDMEGINLRSSSKSTLNGMGGRAHDGSQGSRDEYIDRANDTDLIRKENQVEASSSSAVAEAKDENVSEETFLDQYVDPSLLAKTVVEIVVRGEDDDLNGASHNVETMAALTQNGLHSELLDICRTEKDASMEVDVTASGLDPFTSWEDSIVIGATSECSVADVSLVWGVVSDSTDLLAGNDSVSLNAQDKPTEEGKTPNPGADMEQASPCRSSLVTAVFVSEREGPLPDSCVTNLRTVEIFGLGGEDDGLQGASGKIDADQPSMKNGMAELKASERCEVLDVVATHQFIQGMDGSVHVAPGMAFQARQQDVSSAEAIPSWSFMEKEDKWTAKLDSAENDQEVHASLMHDGRIVTGDDVSGPTEAFDGASQEAFTTSASVIATEIAPSTAVETEKVFEQQLVRNAGDSPLPGVEDRKGTNEIQPSGVLNHSKITDGGKVEEPSGSMLEVVSVNEAAPCDMRLRTPGPFVAVEAVNECMSRAADVEVIVSPVKKLTGANIPGSEVNVRVGTSASEDTGEDKEVPMGMSVPKASVPDEEGSNLVLQQLVLEEALLGEEERGDIVFEDVPKKESSGVEDAVVEGVLLTGGGLSSRVQYVAGKELQAAKGSADFGATTVGTVESVTKQSVPDTVQNMVRDLSREVSTKQEEPLREENKVSVENPNLVCTAGSNATNSSSCPTAEELELPVVSDAVIKCENESRKWEKLMLQGLKLLKSVAADIELRQQDNVSSVCGRTEVHASDELQGNCVDESLPQTMKTRVDTKGEVAVDCPLEIPKIDTSTIAITDVEDRSAVAGILSSLENRSLGRETLTDTEPSQEGSWSEDVKVLETHIISRESPDKVQRLDSCRADCLADCAVNQPEVAGSIISTTIAVDYKFAECNSVVQEAFEGGTERKECKVSVDGSPTLGCEKVDTSVISETTGLIGNLNVTTIDEVVEFSEQNGEQCSGGSQHSIKDGQTVMTEGFKAVTGESGYLSLDTKVSLVDLRSCGVNIGVGSRPDSHSVFDGYHRVLKSELEEISDEGNRGPFSMKSMIRVDKVLGISTHDSLPVAKRTLPVAPNKEASTERATETTFFTSHALEDRKGPASIKRASDSLVEDQERECASVDEVAQKSNGAGVSSKGVFTPTSCKEAGEHLSGGELEKWDRLGLMPATDAIMAGDVVQISHADVSSQDGKDSLKTTVLYSTTSVEALDDPQLTASHEGNAKKKVRAAAEADGSNPTVAVKKKLQTKRKRFTGESERKPTEDAPVDPMPCSFPRVEAGTTQVANADVEEDVQMHGLEEVVRILDDRGLSTIPPEASAADHAVVLWSPEADGVEGRPTDLINVGQTQALALRCFCGKPAVLKTTGYKSQNRGLRYYSCEKFKPTFFTRKRNRKRDDENLTSCHFFKWLDSPRVSMEDKKEIRLQKRRHLEQILSSKAVMTNYSTRSSSKQELSEYDAHGNQGFLEGVPPVSGLSVEEPKHENSEEPEPSSKKRKPNKLDPSLSTADSVAFSTRASAARKRKGRCVVDTMDRSTPGNSSCGDESSHEVSVGDWTDSNPGKLAKRFKSEAHKGDTPAHTYSRRGQSSRPPRRSGYIPRAKHIGRMERATADTHHVRKLLPVALAYEKSREVVLEESSEEEVSGDQKEESNEEGHSLELCFSEEVPSSTSAEREQTSVKLRQQRTSSNSRSGQNGRHKSSRNFGNSRPFVQEVRRNPSCSETSLSGDLHNITNQSPQWIEVPLTCPFENKDSSKPAVSGQQAVQHGVGQYGPFASNHDLVVNFPTASPSGERRTISSNTLLLVKEKAREACLAVNRRRGKSPVPENESQRVAWTSPAYRMKKRSERADVSDSDEEETGPSGSRGLRSLKDMLKRENSDGTVADYEVADESQPPFCECKTVLRRAALKTVLSNSANQGLRYWVCVNHRPLFQKKSLWEGDPNDESCKFFRWLDTPMISYAERKKQLAARRRRSERRRR